jgi:hypothetical protein
MPKELDELIAALFKRGFNPDGVTYVLRLLADEHPVGSERQRQLEEAAKYFLE